MLRRLNEFSLFENGWAPVLTRRIGRNLAVEFAAYPLWLKPYLASPKRGVVFSSWFRATEQSNRILRKHIGDVTVEASPVEVANSLIIFELRLQS